MELYKENIIIHFFSNLVSMGYSYVLINLKTLSRFVSVDKDDEDYPDVDIRSKLIVAHLKGLRDQIKPLIPPEAPEACSLRLHP